MKEKNKALEDEIESSGVSEGQDLDPELKEKIVQRKKEISGGGATRVKLMESPKPVGLQESAAEALVSLLTVRSNRKELARDKKSVMRLIQMLDPKNELVCKKFPVMVVVAVLGGGSQGCRKRLVAAGAQNHLQRLAEMEVAEAKKALQKLSGNRLKTIFSRMPRERGSWSRQISYSPSNPSNQHQIDTNPPTAPEIHRLRVKCLK